MEDFKANILNIIKYYEGLKTINGEEYPLDRAEEEFSKYEQKLIEELKERVLTAFDDSSKSATQSIKTRKVLDGLEYKVHVLSEENNKLKQELEALKPKTILRSEAYHTLNEWGVEDTKITQILDKLSTYAIRKLSEDSFGHGELSREFTCRYSPHISGLVNKYNEKVYDKSRAGRNSFYEGISDLFGKYIDKIELETIDNKKEEL
jgi:hypothetical protein